MFHKLPVIQYKFREEPRIFLALLKEISPELCSVDTPTKALELILASKGAVVFFGLYHKNDLIEIANSLKVFKSAPIKAVVVNFTEDQSIEEKVLSLGVQDFISYKVTSRVLKYKLNFWLRALKPQVKSGPWEVSQSLETLFMQKNEVIECRFDDYFEGDLILSAPENKAQTSQNGEFFGEIKKGHRVQLLGRVTSVQNEFITIQLFDTSKRIIEKMLDEFKKHQSKVDGLMKKIKGL